MPARANVRNAAPGAARQAARRSNAQARRAAGKVVRRPQRGNTMAQIGKGAPGKGTGGRTQTRPKANVGGRPGRTGGPLAGAAGIAGGGMSGGQFRPGKGAAMESFRGGGRTKPKGQKPSWMDGITHGPAGWMEGKQPANDMPYLRPGGSGGFRTLPGMNQLPQMGAFPGGSPFGGMLGSKGGQRPPMGGGMRPMMGGPFMR